MIQSLNNFFAKLVELKATQEKFIEFLTENLPEFYAKFVEKTKKMFGTLMRRSEGIIFLESKKIKAMDLFQYKKYGGNFDYINIASSLKEEMNKEYEVGNIETTFYEFTEKITHANIKATAEKYAIMKYFNPAQAYFIFKKAVAQGLLVKGKNGLLVYAQTESGLWFRFYFWLDSAGEVDVDVREVDASGEWRLGDVVALCDMPLEPLNS